MTLEQFFKETPAEELKILAEVCKPSNVFGGVEVPELEEWRFCDVMQLKDMDLIDAVYGVIGKYCAMTAEEMLNEPAGDFMSFLKFVDMELKKAVAYMQMLKPEPDIDGQREMDLQAAGVEELDKFGEYNIYRAIDPNPAKWDEISEVSFNKMFTKLLMDKDYSAVQMKYNKIVENRLRNGRV